MYYNITHHLLQNLITLVLLCYFVMWCGKDGGLNSWNQAECVTDV